MAEFFVRNSLSNATVVKFNITLRYIVPKGYEGDHKWILEIGTLHPDSNGDPISAKKIHNVSFNNLDEIIENALADMCSQIDWSPLVTDVDKPYISEFNPSDNSTDVSILENVRFTIKDELLSAGIDLTTMKVVLNNEMQDFDITSELLTDGDPYEYSFVWSPPKRVFARYD